MSINHIPSCGNLYIGDVSALDNPALLSQHNITHILSVLAEDYCHNKPQFKKYNRFFLQAKDNFDQDLKSHFEYTNAYIENALAINVPASAYTPPCTSKSPSKKLRYKQQKKTTSKEQPKQHAVFVHCAAGVSRSATTVCAYMMYKFHMPYNRALSLLKESREICDPNDGFRHQLYEYEKELEIEPERIDESTGWHDWDRDASPLHGNWCQCEDCESYRGGGMENFGHVEESKEVKE